MPRNWILLYSEADEEMKSHATGIILISLKMFILTEHLTLVHCYSSVVQGPGNTSNIWELVQK